MAWILSYFSLFTYSIQCTVSMYQTIWQTIQVPRDSTEAVPGTYSAWRVATRLDSRGITSFGLSTEDFFPTLSLATVRWKIFLFELEQFHYQCWLPKFLLWVQLFLCRSAHLKVPVAEVKHRIFLYFKFFSLLAVTVTKQPPVRPSLPLFFHLSGNADCFLLLKCCDDLQNLLVECRLLVKMSTD